MSVSLLPPPPKKILKRTNNNNTPCSYAIAYSVLDHLASTKGCLTLFSTHYHLLCKEVEHNPLVALCHMSCYVDEERCFKTH